MKSILCVLTLCFFAASFATKTSSAASDEVSSVTGGGTFSVGTDTKKGPFNFNAITHKDGSVTGHLSLIDPEDAPDQDVDGTEEAGLESLNDGVELTADVDSVRVTGNRAALSGVVNNGNGLGFFCFGI